MSSGIGGRPTKEQSQAGFEQRVVHLYRSGKKVDEIAAHMDASKRTIYRVLAKAKGQSQKVAAEIKADRIYHKETQDEFFAEKEIQEWVADMKLRRVKRYRDYVNDFRRICEDLGAFPAELIPFQNPDSGEWDFSFAKNWLVMKADVPLDKLRDKKVAYRMFAKKYGASDYELTRAGFDAKHYGVGKWKNVQMTEAQIQEVISRLEAKVAAGETGAKEALFAFRFGVETCRPLEPIWGLTAGQFRAVEVELTAAEKRRIELVKELRAVLPPGMDGIFAELLGVSPESLTEEIGDGKKVLHTVNVFRRKTEKSGAGYHIAYVSSKTHELADVLGREHGNRIMDGFEPNQIYPFLREAYQGVGVHALDPEEKGCARCRSGSGALHVMIDASNCPKCGGSQFVDLDYFQVHPIHALRHTGAQRLLAKTNFNRAVTAKLGGWEAEKTLEDHYGGVPDDVVRMVAGSLL